MGERNAPELFEDDEDDYDEVDDGYWDLDELGIDPEEFYDLCPLFRSLKRLQLTSSDLIP